jgi:hypothetical protein
MSCRKYSCPGWPCKGPSDHHRLFLFYFIKSPKVFINYCISINASGIAYICTSSFQTMSTISITRLYDLLFDKVGKETAESLISFILFYPGKGERKD